MATSKKTAAAKKLKGTDEMTATATTNETQEQVIETTGTAVVKSDGGKVGLAVVTGDAEIDAMLAAFGDMPTGFDQVDDDEFRTIVPKWMVNCPSRDKDTNKRAPKENWTMVGDPSRTVPRLEVILLALRKTRLSTRFVKSEQRNEILCRSVDMENGLTPPTPDAEDGVRRTCSGCPDKEWKDKDVEPDEDKRKPLCSEEWNLICVHAAEPDGPFIRIAFARDDVPKILLPYLTANHVIKRRGQKIRIPFPAFTVALGSREKGEGQGPTMERIGVTPADVAARLALRAEESIATLDEVVDSFLNFKRPEDAASGAAGSAANDNGDKPMAAAAGDDMSPDF